MHFIWADILEVVGPVYGAVSRVGEEGGLGSMNEFVDVERILNVAEGNRGCGACIFDPKLDSEPEESLRPMKGRFGGSRSFG